MNEFKARNNSFSCDLILVLRIDAPSEMKYDPATRTLTFMTPANHCARIELSSADTWRTYAECKQSPVKIDESEKFERIRVAFCLQSRTDVCGNPTATDIGELTKESLNFHLNLSLIFT